VTIHESGPDGAPPLSSWTIVCRRRVVWSTRGLRAREMRILDCLLDHADSTGLAWPSSARVADMLGIRPADVRKEIRSLVARGLLRHAGHVRRTPAYECCPRTGVPPSTPQGVPTSTPQGVPTSTPPVPQGVPTSTPPVPQGVPTSTPEVLTAVNTPKGVFTEVLTELTEQPTTALIARRTRPESAEPTPPSEPKPRKAPKPLKTAKVLTPLDALVIDVWADFNRARSSPQVGLRDLGSQPSPARMAAGRTKLRPLLAAHGHDGARAVSRNAISHQFRDDHARRYPTWETLVRHLEDWSDRWESGQSGSDDPRVRAARWLARRRAADARTTDAAPPSDRQDGHFPRSNGSSGTGRHGGAEGPQNGTSRSSGMDRIPL